MDFAQAKIHSLVTVAEEEMGGAIGAVGGATPPERMRFREVEARFLRQFSMPAEEKLVNCESHDSHMTIACRMSISELVAKIC